MFKIHPPRAAGCPPLGACRKQQKKDHGLRRVPRAHDPGRLLGCVRSTPTRINARFLGSGHTAATGEDKPASRGAHTGLDTKARDGHSGRAEAAAVCHPASHLARLLSVLSHQRAWSKAANPVSAIADCIEYTGGSGAMSSEIGTLRLGSSEICTKGQVIESSVRRQADWVAAPVEARPGVQPPAPPQ